MAVRLSAVTLILAAAITSPAVAFAKMMPGGPGSKQQLIAAVPEPATWAMMLLGFGLVGVLMRVAQRRKPATA